MALRVLPLLALSVERAQGMPGAQPHPQPCVRKVKAHKLKSPQVGRNIPAFPARWFYGLCRALPGDRACLPPSQATMDKHRRQLDASVGASGPPGFAVCNNLTRLLKLRHPPHPAPNVRDDGETPLFRVRDGIALLLFLANQKAKYFFAKDWTDAQIRSMRIYQQRHARMFKRLRCRRATIGCYVGPLSSSAKAYWMPRLRGA